MKKVFRTEKKISVYFKEIPVFNRIKLDRMLKISAFFFS